MKKFFQKYLFFVKNLWHRFLVIKNKIYAKTHRSLKGWFERKYKKNFNRKINFEDPKLFSEKLYLQMMTFSNPLGKTLVDKIEVKNYFKTKNLSKYITPTYACFDKANQIRFDNLQNEFVIKCNHDSGSTFIVNKSKNSIKDRDGRNYSFKRMKRSLRACLKTSTYYQGFEAQYKDVVPRILVEELIKPENGEFLADYKIFCNYGRPVFIYIVVGRTNKGEKTIFVDKDFNLIWTNSEEYKNDYKRFKPDLLDEMFEFASKISTEFQIARVDLYYTKSLGIRFGEIAFSHYGGTNTGASYPDYENDLKLGGMLK